MIYTDKKNKEEIEVIDSMTAGMGEKLLGITIVVYKRKVFDYLFAMENQEFQKRFIKKEIQN